MVPGRMALLVTLFLVLLNIFINITSKSPNTKSLTSISAWVIACIIFVYGALIEYGFILLISIDYLSMFNINNYLPLH